MTPDRILALAIVPALTTLLPWDMDSPNARAMLLAIGLQESGFSLRRQQLGGPARGYWQFEAGGGVVGVLTNRDTRALAIDICEQLDVEPNRTGVIAAIEFNDVLAAVFARLLLWALPDALPDALPSAESPDRGWAMYVSAWRPGKPRRGSWNTFYSQAWSALK